MKTLFSLLKRAWALSRPLTVLGVANLAILAFALAGLLFDHRLITGAPAWLKPAKFAFSIALYAFTLAWLLSFVQGLAFWKRLIAGVTAPALLLEMVIIAGQAARGTTSHFNLATPRDAMLYQVMGLTIVVVWLTTALTAILLLRQRLPDPAFAWSLRLGLLLTLAGMSVGVLMTLPTRGQRAALAQGQRVPVIGGHSVGVPDGGPGLPGTGWNARGGDLRVPHFLGLHALQVLPLLGWLLARRGRWDAGTRLRLVWTAGGLYLGLIGLLTWQALRGQSPAAPDGLTLAVLGSLLAAAAVCVLAIVRRNPAGRARTLTA